MKQKTLANSNAKQYVVQQQFLVAPHSTYSSGNVMYANDKHYPVEVLVYVAREKRNMGNVLATYPSGSNPAKQYNIIQGNDGVVYCDCMGWKMNKHCKHLRDFESGHNVPVPKKADVTLDKTIDQIVSEIKAGGNEQTYF